MRARRRTALVWDALLLELALYRSLARWLLRLPDVPRGAVPIGYAQLAAPMLWLWIFASASEVIFVEVALRNIEAGWAETVRLPLLILGIWGVLWMLGMLAAYRIRPHLLLDDRLRIRNSARTWVDVPLGAVGTIRGVEHEVPGIVRSLHTDNGLLLVGVSSRTNLELELTEPTRLTTSKGSQQAIERVGLWVDNPREAAAQIREASLRASIEGG